MSLGLTVHRSSRVLIPWALSNVVARSLKPILVRTSLNAAVSAILNAEGLSILNCRCSAKSEFRVSDFDKISCHSVSHLLSATENLFEILDNDIRDESSITSYWSLLYKRILYARLRNILIFIQLTSANNQLFKDIHVHHVFYFKLANLGRN